MPSTEYLAKVVVPLERVDLAVQPGRLAQRELLGRELPDLLDHKGPLAPRGRREPPGQVSRGLLAVRVPLDPPGPQAPPERQAQV
jgi:hypothetical protein